MHAHTDTAALVARSPGRTDGALGTFESLYLAQRDFVYRLALRYGRAEANWAQDVVQDVFLIALRKQPEVLAADNPAGWFYRVTTNVCLKRLRRNQLQLRVHYLLRLQAFERPATPERQCGDQRMLRDVDTLLTALTPKERIVFCMRYLDEKTQLEIGQVLGHSKGHICKLLQRIQQKLRPVDWEDTDV